MVGARCTCRMAMSYSARLKTEKLIKPKAARTSGTAGTTKAVFSMAGSRMVGLRRAMLSGVVGNSLIPIDH
jgi:hypothetical protein